MHTVLENAFIAAVVHAHFAGIRAALTMRPGTKFEGADPEAEKAGFKPGTHAHNDFVHAFLDQLAEDFPEGVVTDQNGIIV